MTRRMENIVRRLLYVATAMLISGSTAVGIYIVMHSPAVSGIQWTDVVPPLNMKSDAVSTERDPMISKLAASRMSKAVFQVAPVRVKPPAPNLSVLLRVKGIMDFGDPKSSEAIIESIRGNSTKNYKVDELVDGIDAKVLKIDKVVTFSYDGKDIQLGVNADIGIELPVAGQDNSPVLSDNRSVPRAR